MKHLPLKRANDIAYGTGDVIADSDQINPTNQE
jgi:hypothetical protein